MIAEKVTVDTVELLKECDAGVKTAVKSLDEVLDVVENKELKELLGHTPIQVLAGGLLGTGIGLLGAWLVVGV